MWKMPNGRSQEYAQRGSFPWKCSRREGSGRVTFCLRVAVAVEDGWLVSDSLILPIEHSIWLLVG